MFETVHIIGSGRVGSTVSARLRERGVALEAMRNHEAEIAQTTGLLREGVRRVSERMDTTIADVVHGGALSTLVDTAATAAAWAGAEDTTSLRGTTVALTVNFVGAARGQDVTATARVSRRGRTIVFVDVEATGADGTLVARALVTYKLG